MKIGIIGAGAIGCVAAGVLHKAGEDVLLVGKKDQVDAIQQKGLLIKGFQGESVIPVEALTRLDRHCDLVIFTTKTQDLEQAYQANNEWLEDSLILTSQNGVQADTIIGSHFEKEQMFSSIVMFGATYLAPGEVIYNFPGDWIIGKPYTAINPEAHQIGESLQSAFSVAVVNNITGMKYLKLFVNFNNCLPALLNQSMQETFADLDVCRLSIELLKEGLEIVDRANIELESLPHFPVDKIRGLASMPLDQAAGIIQKTLTTLSEEPVYGSILQSIKRGRSSEIDFINGEVVALGKQMRHPASWNTKVVDLVHQVETTGRFLTLAELKEEFRKINPPAVSL